MNIRKKTLLKASLALLVGATLTLSACGDTSSSLDTTKKLSGTRYRATLSRGIEQKEWAEVAGTHEWWFFGGGVFKQISSDYVEPQFYGDSQACNGEGSGNYVAEEIDDRIYKVTLTYDGVRDVRGSCRMESRDLQIVLQPSGVADVSDGKVVQRLERVETLPQ